MTDLSRFGLCTLDDDGCTTCGDVAVPVRVVRRLDDGTALCEDRTGRRAEIETAFTPGAEAGDVLLVHTGVALARIPDDTAPPGRLRGGRHRHGRHMQGGKLT